MNKNFRDTRLLEAFEYIDPKYVNEVGKDLKLRSVYSKDGEGSGNKMRMSLKQITVLAACALLLAFAIPLFGYVAGVVGSFVAGTAGAGSDPVRESIEDSLPEETNAEQADVNNKYSEYGREEIGENGEKIFYLYTSEEYGAYLEAKNNNKESETLTPEDIVCIINDSVRLYFEYDKIYFSDTVKFENGSTQYMLGDTSAAYNNGFIDTDLLQAARYVIPYHGDFSELNAESAEDQYNKMIDDIYVIIYRRMEVHGGRIYGITYGGNGAEDSYAGNLLDGGRITNADEYITERLNILRSTLEAIKNGEPITNECPLVLLKHVGSKDYFIAIVNNGTSELVYPTKELIELKPQK